jgi:hypothetical protein
MTSDFIARLGIRFIQMVYLDLYTAKDDKPSAYTVLVALRDSTDKIRKNYWQFKLNKLGFEPE